MASTPDRLRSLAITIRETTNQSSTGPRTGPILRRPFSVLMTSLVEVAGRVYHSLPLHYSLTLTGGYDSGRGGSNVKHAQGHLH